MAAATFLIELDNVVQGHVHFVGHRAVLSRRKRRKYTKNLASRETASLSGGVVTLKLSGTNANRRSDDYGHGEERRYFRKDGGPVLNSKSVPTFEPKSTFITLSSRKKRIKKITILALEYMKITTTMETSPVNNNEDFVTPRS